MLLTKQVEVGINGKNYEYYKNLGYDIPMNYDKKNKMMRFVRGYKIIVPINHLSEGSQVIVEVLCDYCKKNIVHRTYKNYTIQKSKLLGEKDCCQECQGIKAKEIYLLKYGVENISQLELIKDKKKETCLNNFGVESPMKDKDIAKRSMKKRAISLYKNGTMSCSKQQEYLCNLFDGQLNYPVNNLSLDIAFPNKKIYLEYAGSGHNLRVKFGDCSEDEFKVKERNRNYYLSKLGWKRIEIKSIKDYLPNDEEIINIICMAIQYLKMGHSWFEINIDERKLKCSQYNIDYDFKTLRKIKKQDL